MHYKGRVKCNEKQEGTCFQRVKYDKIHATCPFYYI